MKNTFGRIFCTWSCFISLSIFGLGWIILAQFFPPISPLRNAVEIAQTFNENNTMLMLASVIMMASVLVLAVFAATLVRVVYNIEKGVGTLTALSVITASTACVLQFLVPFFVSVAAFRPDRDPQLIQLMTDLAFMMFMGGVPMFMMIWGVSAYAILVTIPKNKSRIPLPRWFGYLNLWIFILYIPEFLIFFFKSGPFAWDGIIGFWLPAVLLIGYALLTPKVLNPVLKQLDAEKAA